MMEIYTRLDTKLHLNEPNILKLQLDEEKKQEENKIENRVIGIEYKKDLSKKTYSVNNHIVDRVEKAKEKRDSLHNNKKDTVSQKQSHSIINSHSLVIDESIEAIIEKLERNDIDGAKEIYEKVNLLVNEKDLQQAIVDDKKINLEEIKPENFKENTNDLNKNIEYTDKEKQKEEQNNNIFSSEPLGVESIIENIKQREEEQNEQSEQEQEQDEQENYEGRSWIEENLNKNNYK